MRQGFHRIGPGSDRRTRRAPRDPRWSGGVLGAGRDRRRPRCCVRTARARSDVRAEGCRSARPPHRDDSQRGRPRPPRGPHDELTRTSPSPGGEPGRPDRPTTAAPADRQGVADAATGSRQRAVIVGRSVVVLTRDAGDRRGGRRRARRVGAHRVRRHITDRGGRRRVRPRPGSSGPLGGRHHWGPGSRAVRRQRPAGPVQSFAVRSGRGTGIDDLAGQCRGDHLLDEVAVDVEEGQRCRPGGGEALAARS